MTKASLNGSTVALLLVLVVCGASFTSDGSVAEPENFFRQYMGLNDEQISEIQHGKAIAKILDSPTADQVFVFGSVYIQATPESYLKLAADLDRLRKLPSYLTIREFSDPPVLSDLDGFTLEQEDIKQLKDCRPGKCEVQLPADVMEEFQKSVDWTSPNAAEMANHTAQQIALRALKSIYGGATTP